MARRSGLGKGLSALIPSEAMGETDSALRVVPISHIKPNVFQPRSHFDEESMSSLAASIREVGLLQPVLVREVDGEDESYELIAGERRWRAARRAGLQTIPVLVQPDTGDVTSLEQALVENLHREDLNALEEAAAYQQLIDEFGLTAWVRGGPPLPTHSDSCSCRPEPSERWPRRLFRPVTPEPCWVRPTATCRISWWIRSRRKG
jgi:ParB family chromosome partitioning protein